MLPPQLRLVVEYLQNAEFCLGLSSALVLLVGGIVLASGNVNGASYLVTGGLMLVSVLLARGYLTIRRLDEILPVVPVSGITGILLLSSSVISLAVGGNWWTTWVILIAGVLALYSAYLRLRRPPPLL